MKQVIKPLKEAEVTEILFKLGNRKLILLEGPTDTEVMEGIWYAEFLDRVMFYDCGGNDNVIRYCHSIKKFVKQAYGIIDRDFKEESEVGVHNGILVLSLFCLENYLLFSNTVYEELRIALAKKFTSSLAELEKDLLELCRRLIPIVASNWLIWEEKKGKEAYLTPGFPAEKRDFLLQQLSEKMGTPEATLQDRLIQKEKELECLLEKLEMAYTRISGKYLLKLLYQHFHFPASESYIRRRLADRAKIQGSINKEIHDFVMGIIHA